MAKARRECAGPRQADERDARTRQAPSQRAQRGHGAEQITELQRAEYCNRAAITQRCARRAVSDHAEFEAANERATGSASPESDADFPANPIRSCKSCAMPG